MSPTMVENQKPPISSEISTPIPNSQPPRRSRPRVREVSSRFMSPVTSSSSNSTPLSSSLLKSPINPNPNPRSLPSTPFDHHSRNHPIRRSNSVQRPRYADENRPDSVNRSSVSPVRASKPRSAVKLFKEPSRTDTPVPLVGPAVGSRLARTWDSAASKLLQASGLSVSVDHQGDDESSIDSDGVSVKSEPCDHNNTSSSSSTSHSNESLRVSTPVSRSMELTFGGHEQNGVLHSVKGGGHSEKVGSSLLMRSCSGSVKVARSLNLPPMPPSSGCSKPQGMMDVKGARKGSNQQEDMHRLKLLHNHYLQWKLVNAKAEAAMIARKRESERQLYLLAVKISELQDSVKSKRAEVGFLQRTKALSTILDAQIPHLDEWSALEEDFSASLLALTQGLQNVSSQLPLVGNVKADVKEIEEALNWALKAVETIFLQVQSYMPTAEQVDCLISDLARVCSKEVELVEECGYLLSKTQLSQVEECSLRGQLMQFHRVEECSLRGQLMQFHRVNFTQTKEKQAS